MIRFFFLHVLIVFCKQKPASLHFNLQFISALVNMKTPTQSKQDWSSEGINMPNYELLNRKWMEDPS